MTRAIVDQKLNALLSVEARLERTERTSPTFDEICARYRNAEGEYNEAFDAWWWDSPSPGESQSPREISGMSLRGPGKPQERRGREFLTPSLGVVTNNPGNVGVAELVDALACPCGRCNQILWYRFVLAGDIRSVLWASPIRPIRATNRKTTRSRAAPILLASIRTQVSRARVVIHRKIRVVRKAAVISRSRVVKTPSARPSAKGAFGRPYVISRTVNPSALNERHVKVTIFMICNSHYGALLRSFGSSGVLACFLLDGFGMAIDTTLAFPARRRR